jgi:hypothetical protein
MSGRRHFRRPFRLGVAAPPRNHWLVIVTPLSRFSPARYYPMHMGLPPRSHADLGRPLAVWRPALSRLCRPTTFRYRPAPGDLPAGFWIGKWHRTIFVLLFLDFPLGLPPKFFGAAVGPPGLLPEFVSPFPDPLLAFRVHRLSPMAHLWVRPATMRLVRGKSKD